MGDLVKLSDRPSFGDSGRWSMVYVNAYPVTQFPACKIYQYDCTLGADGSKRALIRKLWNHPKLQEKFGDARLAVIFDGSKLAWSMKELPFGSDLTMTIDLDEGAPARKFKRDSKHRIVIKKTGEVPLQLLFGYLAGKSDYDSRILSCLTFLDHLIRETPSNKFLTIKRSFFEKGHARELSQGVEAWKGIFQSIRAAQGGRLIMNVDVATAVFWTEGNLLQVACRMLRLKSGDELQREIERGGPRNKVLRELRRLKKIQFFCKHRSSDRNTDRPAKKRIFTIEGFGDNAIRTTFDVHKTDDRGQEVKYTTNVADYYFKNYGLRIQFPGLPLVKTRRLGESYPMELCWVEEGQRYPFKLNDVQTADMIKFTVTKPQTRLNHIKENVTALGWGKDTVLQEYGMRIDDNMIKTKARIMPTPRLEYGPGSVDGKFVPRDGRWDLRGKKFVELPKVPLKCWGIMVFNSPRACPEEAVMNFVRMLVQQYASHGGKVEQKDPPIMYADSKKAVSTNSFEFFKKTGNRMNMKPQLLVYILAQKSTQPYNDIKAYCDIHIGVNSQCLQTKHVLACKPQYGSNVCMKINGKLGGSSVFLSNVDDPLFKQEPTLIVGADVSHAAPGHAQTSYASMVGSTNLRGTRFCAIANTNGSRVEIIKTENMTRFILTMLRTFRQESGKVPMRIFYFRDGVSEGEYAQLVQNEIADIKSACNSLQAGYSPKITVVVCSKRHHFRFFPTERNGMDRNGNPVPGTIVERDITHPKEYDFYLTSHSAIQGTSRPVHYHVLLDENRLPVNDLQRYIYNYCYCYIRATNAVSLVPATYYAHLASSRARVHEPINDDGFTVSSGNKDSDPPGPATDSRDKDPDHNLKELHAHMRASMWFI